MQKDIFDATPGAEISVMRYRHASMHSHTHDFLELVYILEGSALHTVNGHESIVRPGDFFIVDFSGSHSYKMTDNDHIQLFNILFTPNFIDPVLSDCRSFSQITEHYLIKFRNIPISFEQETVFRDEDNFILNMIKEMESEYVKRSPGYAEILRCKLIEIIIQILRKISENSVTSEHPCVKTILEHINNKYMTRLSLSEISKELNYSSAYLSRLFKKQTGMSFAEFLQKKRIENSCRLLLSSDKKVSEIASMVGYSDLKSFQSAFKKNIGMPPKTYQKIRHKN